MVKRNKHADLSQCPLACALDIIGDHWTLLIIRNLMLFGCHEYKDMLAMPEAISANILSNRLKKLAEAGIIADAPHPDSKRRKLYYLTGKEKIWYTPYWNWRAGPIGISATAAASPKPRARCLNFPLTRPPGLSCKTLPHGNGRTCRKPPITPDERPL